MGLDITAASRMEFVCALEGDEDDWPDGLRFVYANPDFPDHIDGRTEGLYRITGMDFNFRAGSYHGYNYWRSQLSELALGAPADDVYADPSRFVGKCAYELINFSDCEGSIGPETCAKLRDDLDGLRRSLQPKHLELVNAGYSDGLLDTWIDAFRLGADGGFVMFH